MQLAKREDAHWSHIQNIPEVMCVSFANKRAGRSLPSLAPRHQSIHGQVSGALVNVQLISVHPKRGLNAEKCPLHA